jgi:hypothetical protein
MSNVKLSKMETFSIISAGERATFPEDNLALSIKCKMRQTLVPTIPTLSTRFIKKFMTTLFPIIEKY